MKPVDWWNNGYIVRTVVSGREETSVALITFFRILTVAVTVTELGGVHLGMSLRVLWMEASFGLAMWDKGIQQ